MSSTTSASSRAVPLRTGDAARPKKSVLYSPAAMVTFGLGLRIFCIAALGLYRFNLIQWLDLETANIGRSLALGHGFGSPFGASTGPTAWVAPLYPWLGSLAFRAFGIFSHGAAFALLAFNSVCSALTSWTIYRITRRVFGETVAVWSGWIWAIFPYAIYWPVIWVWDTSLSAFLLSLAFMVTLEMQDDNRLWTWFRYGLLWGVIALTNTSMVCFLPFSGCWLAYQLHLAGKRFSFRWCLARSSFGRRLHPGWSEIMLYSTSLFSSAAILARNFGRATIRRLKAQLFLVFVPVAMVR